MNFRRNRLLIMLLAGMLLSACGYRFAGTGNLPHGTRTLFVDVLVNRTAETGIENTFTADLRYQFVRNQMTAERSRADGILSGSIRSLQVQTISRRGQNTAQERRVTASVDLTLKKQNGQAIWSLKGVSANEAYAVASDDRATEANKRAAIIALSARLAENIYYRLTEDF